jgi:hypothetical protein
MKEHYRLAYKKLAQHYIDKKDANLYLENYAHKLNGIYLPINDEIITFVEAYYARYKEIGQQVYVA